MGNTKQVIIIGGGLSGLLLAYLLQKEHIKCMILEASPRLGGRIQTIMGPLHCPLELGATWFSDLHPDLLSVTEELGLEKFPQFSSGISFFQTKSFEPPQKFYVPESEAPSYRLAGGTQRLTDALDERLETGVVKLNSKVSCVEELDDKLKVSTSEGAEYIADKVVVCIPPQLVCSQLRFYPALPLSLAGILPSVQTWMAGSVKFTLEYNTAFWKEKGYSGMLYSHSGIIIEMYDHSNFENNCFGFTGFLNSNAADYTVEVREELVRKQLVDLFGAEAGQPVAYFDKVWNNEYILSGNQIIQRPHQNNGHALLQQIYLGGKLFFSGTETAERYAGYMEGAVVAAKRTAKELVSSQAFNS